MIGHDAALDLAAIALDFELSADERVELDMHLNACADCRRRAADLRGDAEGVMAVRVLPLDPVRADGIIATVLARPAPAAHPLRLALVAALLGLVAIGAATVGAGMLRHARDGLSNVSPAPAVTVAPEPTGVAHPTPTPAPSLLAADEPIWVRLGDQATFANSAMQAVVAGDDRYVAVGCITDTSGSLTEEACTGAAWVSTDGRSWRRSEIATSQHSLPTGVISTPVGYIAWGTSLEDETQVPIWRSSDGLTWERSAAAFGHWVTNIVWREGRLVAYLDWAVASAPAPPFFHTSTDGLSWTPVTTPTDCRTLPDGRSGDLLAAGPSLLMPHLTSDEGIWRGGVATSTDAACWSVSEPIGGSIMGMVTQGSGYVAVGSQDSEARAAGDPPPPMAAWTSADGAAFTRASFSPAAPPGSLRRLVSSGDRLIAFGEALAGGFGYEPASWTSMDGATWRKARSVPDATADGLERGDCTGGPCDLYRTKIQGLAARSDSLVAVGLTHLAAGGVRAVVWVADPATAVAPVQLAAGSDAVTLTSDLRVRSQPRVADDSIKYEPLLAEGTLLQVLAGPVYDTGYWWYRVSPFKTQGGLRVQLKLSGGATEGWVAAAAKDGTPWIGPPQAADCGPDPCPS